MARNAPQITVKDLTKAMQIQDQKTRTELASQSGGNRLEDMTGYGKDWPGTMKDQGFGDEPGTDPAEMIQLELPLDLVKKLQIMAQENPEIAQGITDELMIAHGEGRGPQPKYHDEYNQPLKFPPWMHINPSGEQIEIPWQKEDYLKEHPNLKISGATSRQIRDKLKPYTRGGPADYDKEGGSLRDLPASLRIKLLKA